ncbi:hypothetical protein CPC16_001460 [Podila verticillata]|nr:hypothetical protein CPC16_001460 [Podila verticillata]
MASPAPTSTSPSTEDESILSFLTTDFLESQASFDSTPFFDSLTTEALLHPPSPPTSVGTYSESSGSPHNSNLDSCDEGSGSDVPMDHNPLEYWQYVYPDLQATPFPILADGILQQQPLPIQPGAWPSIPNMNPLFSVPSNFDHTPSNSESTPGTPPRKNSKTMPTPPSPAISVKAEKTEKRTKRAKKQQSPPTSLPPLAPLVPLAPLKPLVSLAPQPTPPSPPTSVHDTFIKQSPPLSPCIMPAQAPSPTPSLTPVRRPSIVPALTPSLTRSNPVIVKSSLIPEEKPQSDAVLSAQAKRQERLIKNRAAALLSRKRKREHINLLESHTDLLKMDNQELKERVSELEENVKVLTEERDAARKECERLHHQVKVLTHRPYTEATRMDMDLERNLRNTEERGLNSKATGVVFMIILFSFALFNLPGGKLETLMVGGGSINRPRIGTTIVGRALDSYTKNPTISGQVREPGSGTRQDLNNMTDLVVFSDNRALQAWLGHEPVTIAKESGESTTPVTSPPKAEAEINDTIMEAVSDETTKSVGFVAQSREHRSWPSPISNNNRNEPDRDALLYCANLLYSLDHTTVTQDTGSQSTNGEFRRPRLSIISPLDGVVGSSSNDPDKNQLPPWMPNREPSEDELQQRYLRLDVEVTSSRVVSGKSLENHEQLIRFPLMPVGMFDNATTSLVPSTKGSVPTPASAASSAPSITGRRRLPGRSGAHGRVNAQGGVTKTRRTYDSKDQFFKVAHDVAPPPSHSSQNSIPLASIKEEPMEVYIKEEPMD